MFEITVKDCPSGKQIMFITEKFLLAVLAERDTFGVRAGGCFSGKELDALVTPINAKLRELDKLNFESGIGSARKVIEETWEKSSKTIDDFEVYVHSMNSLGAVHSPREP